MDIAARLGRLELANAITDEVEPLEALWHDSPAVVVFLRHFG